MGIMNKVSSASTQAPRRCRPKSQPSSQTSVANLQITKEALQIGEFLRLKVIANKKAATTRITNTMKKAMKAHLHSQLDKQPSK